MKIQKTEDRRLKTEGGAYSTEAHCFSYEGRGVKLFWNLWLGGL